MFVSVSWSAFLSHFAELLILLITEMPYNTIHRKSKNKPQNEGEKNLRLSIQKTKGNWLSLRRVDWNTAEICFCCWEILFVISFSIYPNNILSKDVILINTINDRKESLNTCRLSTQFVSLPFQKEDPLTKQQNFWKGGCWNLGGYIGFCLDGSWEGFECVYSWKMG